MFCQEYPHPTLQQLSKDSSRSLSPQTLSSSSSDSSNATSLTKTPPFITIGTTLPRFSVSLVPLYLLGSTKLSSTHPTGTSSTSTPVKGTICSPTFTSSKYSLSSTHSLLTWEAFWASSLVLMELDSVPSRIKLKFSVLGGCVMSLLNPTTKSTALFSLII